MMNKVIIYIFLMFPLLTQAKTFIEKPIASFQPLNTFATVEDFEQPINEYVKYCLDNSFGGSLSVRCYVGEALWDRELNYYYRLLYRQLDSEGKALLKASQRAWLDARDKTMAFNYQLISQRYPQSGTMYVAIRANVANGIIMPIVKQRALLLKTWLEDVG
ncbi:lysozyme inhibitor LprI family protein [Photobacterium nomapromontoriensis]|uniref:lysozyme inhibitor LprI family protein n=1 Tax=Photobacterium nomapromontoriensis TaxID=2910237 RepID=UPI003D10DF23